MWLNPYVQEMLIRDRIAEAHRLAARQHLLSLVKPPVAPARVCLVTRRLAQAVAVSRLKRLIERMASS